MKQETYSEKLKLPQWQRRRLEKMQQANFSCEICKDDSEELHVHHKHYLNVEPWDYPDSVLMCLCKTCHDIMHMDKNKVRAHAQRLSITQKTEYIRYEERLVPMGLIRQIADIEAAQDMIVLRIKVAEQVKALRKEIDHLMGSILGSLRQREKIRKETMSEAELLAFHDHARKQMGRFFRNKYEEAA